MGRRKGSRILSASKSYWNKFKTNPEDIAALKKFIDTADEQLSLVILKASFTEAL